MSNYYKSREAAGGYGNTVLYRMCLEDQPRHVDPDVVAGKMWLIGRSYSASPERGAGETPTGEHPDFFRWVAERVEWRHLDEKLDALSTHNVFGQNSLDQILEIHESLRQALRKATQLRVNGGEPRQHTSFCSKYLHFHKPDHFPIFDSYVSSAVTRETGARKRFAFEAGRHDRKYSRFCQQIMIYREGKSNLTLRDIDRELYESQRKYRMRKKIDAL